MSDKKHPELSIVVPVYGVEGFIRETLDSILEQNLVSYEVIIINDCSPDGSQRIIDEFTSKHAEFRSIELKKNVGLGRARNIGFAEAKGEYITCIDSDDSYEPNALNRALHLANELTCDFVIMNHARTWWWGKYVKNMMTSRLEALAPLAETESDIAELFDNLVVAWNKVFRRSFLEKHSLKNGEGYYEDIPLSYPALARADRVGIVPEVCVKYRQRNGSILLSADARHMDLIAQYDYVLDDFRRIDVPRPTFLKLLERIVDHYIVLLFKKKERLPAELRSLFLERASAQLRAYATYDEVIEAARRSNNKRRHATVIWSGSPIAYSGFHLGKHAIAKAKSEKKNITKHATDGWRKGKLAFYNQLVKRYPIDKRKVMFSAYFGSQYACNPKYISEALHRIAPDYQIVWEVKGTPAIEFPDYVTVAKRGTPQYYFHLATARVFVNNVNFPDVLIKREGTVHIQTQHGTPLKTMGLDLIGGYPAAHKMSGAGLARRSRRWDYCISSNAHSSEIWRRAFPYSYEMLEIGYPRNDILVNSPPSVAEKVRAYYSIPANKKVLLYMPTHREYTKKFVPPLDFSAMEHALGDDYVCLYRAHHFHSASLASNDFIIDASGYADAQELLLTADVLLTDFSSAMFDYAILDRPIVLFIPDLEAYRLIRGLYLDVEAIAPGDLTESTDALIEALSDSRLQSEEIHERRQVFRERFCAFDNGDAAERVVREVILRVED